MRIKITFGKTFKSPAEMPLHHQMILSKSLDVFIDRHRDRKTFYNFSSLKGSSNVKDGNITFLTNKVNLTVSGNDDEFVKSMVERMFLKHVIKVGKMLLMPKVQQIVSMPHFKNEMKYVCLAPFVIIDSDKEPERVETIIDPLSQEFSDVLFHSTMERMNMAGFTEDELKSFETFEVIPDKEYLKKTVESNKRYTRFYRNLAGQTITGYLLPFTLHAHPKVHEFIFETGIGLYTMEGYGMIDIVNDRPKPAAKFHSHNKDESKYAGPTVNEFFS